jgi:hypothetical protein
MCRENPTRGAIKEARWIVADATTSRQQVHREFQPLKPLSGMRTDLWNMAVHGVRLAGFSFWSVTATRYGLAQSTSVSVNGTVRDQSGALISGVQIVLTNIDIGGPRTAATGSAGVSLWATYIRTIFQPKNQPTQVQVALKLFY